MTAVEILVERFCGGLCFVVGFMYLTPRFNERGILVENTKVAMTAPTGRQVKNIMTPEIRRLIRAARTKFPFVVRADWLQMI